MNTNGTMSGNTQKMQMHKSMKKSAPSQTTMRREEVNLRDTDIIDLRLSGVLNASSEGSDLAEVLAASPTRPMVSDVDEQLLFRVVMSGVFAVTHIKFTVPDEIPEGCSPPKHVKIFVNKDNLDFGDADDMQPAAAKELELVDGELVFPVSGPSFSRVSSVQVLVETNQDDEEKTVIQQFSIIGAMIPQYM
jgi:hypothetical protein